MYYRDRVNATPSHKGVASTTLNLIQYGSVALTVERLDVTCAQIGKAYILAQW